MAANRSQSAINMSKRFRQLMKSPLNPSDKVMELVVKQLVLVRELHDLLERNGIESKEEPTKFQAIPGLSEEMKQRRRDKVRERLFQYRQAQRDEYRRQTGKPGPIFCPKLQKKHDHHVLKHVFLFMAEEATAAYDAFTAYCPPHLQDMENRTVEHYEIILEALYLWEDLYDFMGYMYNDVPVCMVPMLRNLLRPEDKIEVGVEEKAEERADGAKEQKPLQKPKRSPQQYPDLKQVKKSEKKPGEKASLQT